mmetsp:Transcript_7886/g.18435  ORF Transcript_7886/g.18435 Transcript_7886/m.18435 type:complete len:893 (-) Transcript_7886:11-2689(-)
MAQHKAVTLQTTSGRLQPRLLYTGGPLQNALIPSSSSHSRASSSTTWLRQPAALSGVGILTGISAAHGHHRRQQHYSSGELRHQAVTVVSARLATATEVQSATKLEELDKIRFDSFIYYVLEGDQDKQEEACIEVLRFGSLEGTCSVHYATADCSAQAGARYEAVSGELVFGPGECKKELRIKIISDGFRWNATLEFQVQLSQPKGCSLGGPQALARVKVIDRNVFPSDAAKSLYEDLEAIELADEGPTESVKGFITQLQLFWEYCLFNFKYTGDMARRTVTALFIDLSANIIFLWTTYLLKYTADDVFGSTPEIPLLVADSKPDTLLLVGVLYVGLYLSDLLLSLWRESLEISQKSKVFLQESLFTKYMNYSPASRQRVSGGKLTVAITTSVDELVNSGYLKLIELARNIGRLFVSSYFILEENPDCELPLTLFGTAVLTFIAFRYKGESDTNEKVVKAEARVAEVVQEGSSKYNLVAEYFARPQLIDTLRSRTTRLASASLQRTRNATINSYFPGGVSAVLIAVYVYFGGNLVLSGALEVGVFLTTIALLKEIAESYKEIFVCILEIARASGAAFALTEMLNFPTHLLGMKAREEKRRSLTRELWRQHEDDIRDLADKAVCHRTPTGDFCSHSLDVVPITLSEVSFKYVGADFDILHKASISAPQGTLVGIVGKPRAGKSTVLRILGGVETPTTGTVIMPSYLQTLHVTMEASLLTGSLWKNLALGRQYWARNGEDFETLRIIQICQKLGLSEKLVKVLQDTREAYIKDAEADDFVSKSQWIGSLSHTDKVLIHVARAFIFNPEVLVMNRPGIALPDVANQRIMNLLKEFVRERGVGLPEDERFGRRPRTAFVCFSTRRVVQADIVWKVEDGQIVDLDKEEVSEFLQGQR